MANCHNAYLCRTGTPTNWWDLVKRYVIQNRKSLPTSITAKLGALGYAPVKANYMGSFSYGGLKWCNFDVERRSGSLIPCKLGAQNATNPILPDCCGALPKSYPNLIKGRETETYDSKLIYS